MLFPSIKISPENQFLLLCARLNWSEKEHEAFSRLIAGKLNWDVVYTGIEQNGIVSLVYANLNKFEVSSSIPVHFWEKLKNDAEAYKRHIMLQRFELWRLLDSFHKANIPAIPLKGSFLRETVYPDPALRISEDLDVLIQPKDVEVAKQVLRKLGRSPDISSYNKDQYLPEKRHHLVPYVLLKHDARIEIHWNIARPSQLLNVDIDGVWQRSSQGKIVDALAYILSPEDLLLHLALHAACFEKNKFLYPLVSLRQVIDVARTVQFYQDQLDWDCLLRRAREWGMQEPLFLMLALAKDLLGAAEVEPYLEAVKPAQFDWFQYTATRRAIFRLSEVNLLGAETGVMLQFKLAETRMAKAQLLWKTLFAEPDVIASRYLVTKGSKRFILFSVLNPLLLSYRYVRMSFFNKKGS